MVIFANDDLNKGPEGQACTMVVRTPHWTVPHYWVWGLPFFLFYSTRASQFLHERPNQSILKTLLCYLLSPMVSQRINFLKPLLRQLFLFLFLRFSAKLIYIDVPDRGVEFQSSSSPTCFGNFHYRSMD